MSTYRQRKGLVIFKQTASSNLQVGASYKVNVRPPGAVVSSGTSGVATATVYAGHGFQANDKMLVFGGAVTTIRTVNSLTGTTQLNLSGIITLSAGDVLINLGTDTGTTSPNWVESSTRIEIYAVPNNGSPVSGSLATADANGEYSYWHGNADIWEVIRDTGGTVQKLVTDAAFRWINTPSTTVDNGLLIWDGIDGTTIQAFAAGTPTANDTTGAVQVAGTLGVTGATTLSSTLNAGVSTLASAAVTAGATVGTSLTVGTTLGVTGATTLSSTLAAGATTITGAATVSTTLDVTGNITGSAALRGGSVSVNVTGNDAITTADRFQILLTNVSGTNTITLVAPSSVNGKLLTLVCVALTAGTFSLADSGNVALSAAWTPNADDTLTLEASGVVWKEVSRSTN